jgi:hypothetical protein
MIFANVSQVKDFIPISENFNFEDLQPIIVNVSEPELLVEIIGQALYDDLNNKVKNAEGSITGKSIELLRRCRNLVAPHALLNYIPLGRVTITNGGIIVTLTETIRSASEGQIYDLKNQLNLMVSRGIESLYKYLEDNKADFALWTASSAFTLLRSNFINTSTQFNQYISINSNRLLFNKLRPIMTDVEDLYIKNILGQPLYLALKAEVLAGTTTLNNAKLFPYINRAVAFGSMAEAVNQLDLEITPEGFKLSYVTSNMGEKKERTPADVLRLQNFQKRCEENRDSALTKLKEFLDTNNTDYPTYPYVIVTTSEINESGKGIALI